MIELSLGSNNHNAIKEKVLMAICFKQPTGKSWQLLIQYEQYIQTILE